MCFFPTNNLGKIERYKHLSKYTDKVSVFINRNMSENIFYGERI